MSLLPKSRICSSAIASPARPRAGPGTVSEDRDGAGAGPGLVRQPIDSERSRCAVAVLPSGWRAGAGAAERSCGRLSPSSGSSHDRSLVVALRLGVGEGDINRISFPKLNMTEGIKRFTKAAYGRELTFEHV